MLELDYGPLGPCKPWILQQSSPTNPDIEKVYIYIRKNKNYNGKSGDIQIKK